MKAYDEIIDFIASGTSPQMVMSFKPSRTAKDRVADLLEKEKTTGLSQEDKSELDHYMQLEHIMRMAKVRAQEYIPNE